MSIPGIGSDVLAIPWAGLTIVKDLDRDGRQEVHHEYPVFRM